MKNRNTTRIRDLPDGTTMEVLPNGELRPYVPKHVTDWARIDAMTDEVAHANALADPDNQPLPEEFKGKIWRGPHVRAIRRNLKLTQEEFAARYEIPVGTIRDWEQRRAEPDAAARAYLRAIIGDPDGVARALKASIAVTPKAAE
jgi:putative transcriptional regulator